MCINYECKVIIIKMLRFGVLSILTAVALVYQVKSIELLANYKIWRSASDKLVYDFSGNSRHAKLDHDFVFTDRGVATKAGYGMRLMQYGLLKSSDYTLSFWTLNFGPEYKNVVIHGIHHITPFSIYYMHHSSYEIT